MLKYLDVCSNNIFSTNKVYYKQHVCITIIGSSFNLLKHCLTVMVFFNLVQILYFDLILIFVLETVYNGTESEMATPPNFKCGVSIQKIQYFTSFLGGNPISRHVKNPRISFYEYCSEPHIPISDYTNYVLFYLYWTPWMCNFRVAIVCVINHMVIVVRTSHACDLVFRVIQFSSASCSCYLVDYSARASHGFTE